MAQRPVFVSNVEGPSFVQILNVDFEWFPGLSISQKRRSISSFHAAACEKTGIRDILEVSSKSKNSIGVALSAFNLLFSLPTSDRRISVECLFQGSKVFERGGPFTDIFAMSPREAKGDDRLRTSGHLVGFRFGDAEWSLEPKTAFYDWLYINALLQNRDLAKEAIAYSAFTDIEFNPLKSLNCQAHSVALYVALNKRGLIEQTVLHREAFLGIIQMRSINQSKKSHRDQGVLF